MDRNTNTKIEELLMVIKKIANVSEEMEYLLRMFCQILETLDGSMIDFNLRACRDVLQALDHMQYENDKLLQLFTRLVEENRETSSREFRCRPAANYEMIDEIFNSPKTTNQGNVASPNEDKTVELQKVQFSAVAPKTMVRGAYSIVNVVMYEEAYRHVVDELIESMGEAAQEAKSGVQKVSENSQVKIVLNSPDLAVEDNVETGIWQGEYLNFSFAVELPKDYEKQQILFIAAVYINDVIASKLKFVVKCSSQLEQKLKITREDVLSAFISYASQDRNRVATIIQGMKKARPDLDVFFDVENLRSGEDWEETLHGEIEKRDVLFLCWSHFARESKWVDAEWRYALEKKGQECIEPVPLESPDTCPPPEELSRKHFNDKLLYIINE